MDDRLHPDVEVRTTVRASPDRLYELVADLPRMGEWSPENTGARWLGGDSGARPGARFKGSNRHGWRRWQTTCTILAAEPGRRIVWESRLFGLPVARWSYTFEPDGGGGTTVTEATEDRRNAVFKALSPVAAGVSDRVAHNRATMELTLQRLKAAAETG
jgi:uncharacterized protein YndB with AHSA1/START domain